jgi:hypothetical protein
MQLQQSRHGAANNVSCEAAKAATTRMNQLQSNTLPLHDRALLDYVAGSHNSRNSSLSLHHCAHIAQLAQAVSCGPWYASSSTRERLHAVRDARLHFDTAEVDASCAERWHASKQQHTNWEQGRQHATPSCTWIVRKLAEAVPCCCNASSTIQVAKMP